MKRRVRRKKKQRTTICLTVFVLGIMFIGEDVKGRGGSGYVVKKDNLVLEEWFGSN